ncbi:MAG: type II secretion system F family protein [Acetobacteraceae bacterium]
MTWTSPIVLISAGLLILVGFAFSGLQVARAQAEQQRFARRVGDVLQRHSRSRRFVAASILTRPAGPRRSALARAAALLGFDLARPEQCPLPWWLVLLAAVAVAKAGQSVATMLLGRVGWLVLPVGVIVISRWMFGCFSGRRREQLLRQFPDSLTMIVRSVRVGVPVGEAMRAVAREMPAPTGPEFDRVVQRLALGGQIEDALHEMAARAGLAEYRFFAMALSLQNQTGGGLSETLDGLADMIRRRLAVKERGKALASESQMSIYVLSSLPPFCSLGLWIMNPKYFGVLLHTSTGQHLLGASAAMLSLGWFIMRWMMRKSLS